MNTVRIKEASNQVGIEAHTLRFYEHELNLPIGRDEKNGRIYTQEDIEVFEMVQYLTKEEGYKLAALAKKIADRDSDESILDVLKQIAAPNNIYEEEYDDSEEETAASADYEDYEEYDEYDDCDEYDDYDYDDDSDIDVEDSYNTNTNINYTKRNNGKVTTLYGGKRQNDLMTNAVQNAMNNYSPEQTGLIAGTIVDSITVSVANVLQDTINDYYTRQEQLVKDTVKETLETELNTMIDNKISDLVEANNNKDREYYRKLDETMRELQRMQGEVADLQQQAEGKKKKSFVKRLFGGQGRSAKR